METDNQMLLCSVLVSNIVEVPENKDRHSTLKKPPFIPGVYPPLRYDTTAKNSYTMDVIVKFEDDTYYPEYVIHFNREPKNGCENTPGRPLTVERFTILHCHLWAGAMLIFSV